VAFCTTEITETTEELELEKLAPIGELSVVGIDQKLRSSVLSPDFRGEYSTFIRNDCFFLYSLFVGKGQG